MNREETLALWGQGKDAWNDWANALLAERAALEADGRWSLQQGMFGEAQLTIEKKSDVIMVPETAIQYDAEKPFVYVIESDLLTQKFLTLGLKGVNLGATDGTASTTVVEVVSGLDAGAKVVKLNLGNLRIGSSVRFVTPTPTSTPNAKS